MSPKQFVGTQVARSLPCEYLAAETRAATNTEAANATFRKDNSHE